MAPAVGLLRGLMSGTLCVAACAACLLSMAGCRGATDDQAIREVIRKSAVAIDHEAFVKQCSLMSSSSQVAQVAYTRNLQTNPATRGLPIRRTPLARTCPDALTALRAPSAPPRPRVTEQSGAFDNLPDARVTITGHRAVVTDLSVPALGKRTVRLVKVDGKWYMN